LIFTPFFSRWKGVFWKGSHQDIRTCVIQKVEC